MQSALGQARTIVIQPSGHVNGENASALKHQLAEAISSYECASLLIDMSQVESLDSAGLMVFVSTLTLAQRLSKQFGLVSISPSVRIIFELTQLDRVFEILDSYATLSEVA